MDRDAFATRMDHTVLGPETTPGAVEAALDVAAEHGMNACIPPCYAAERVWRDGADEVDVVLNVGRPHAGDDTVADGLAAETGAAFVEASTGASGGGATVEDVEIMSEYLPVKASGGIDGFETALSMLEAGADRIGASVGATIVEGFDAEAVTASSFDPAEE